MYPFKIITFITIKNISQLKSIFIGWEYTTFAEVITNNRGYRRLVYDGHGFGIKYQNSYEICWRCTIRPCRAKLRTKLINGYEMIKTIDIKHDHKYKLHSKQ